LSEVNEMSEEIIETSEVIEISQPVENKEFVIEIKISNANLQYKSDFNEAETVFWMESVKTLILKNAFDKVNQTPSE
jgi:hypothetical protein